MSDDDTRALGDEPDERPDPDLDPASAPEPRGDLGPVLEEPPGPINWNLLSAHDAEQAWLELNQWVNWLPRIWLKADCDRPAHKYSVGIGRVVEGSIHCKW